MVNAFLTPALHEVETAALKAAHPVDSVVPSAELSVRGVMHTCQPDQRTLTRAIDILCLGFESGAPPDWAVHESRAPDDVQIESGYLLRFCRNPVNRRGKAPDANHEIKLGPSERLSSSPVPVRVQQSRHRAAGLADHSAAVDLAHDSVVHGSSRHVLARDAITHHFHIVPSVARDASRPHRQGLRAGNGMPRKQDT